MELYDVIIVGAGPGGLTAGLYAGRSKLNVIAIEQGLPGGELLNTEGIEDYPGFEFIRGIELAERFEKHALKFGLRIVTDSVRNIRRDGPVFVVESETKQYRSLSVIVTAGGSPVKLGVPGETEFAGRGVSYCAICDGAFFRDQVIAVVGGGDSAVEEGTFLTKYGSKVYVIHRRDRFRAQAVLQERLLSNPKAEPIWNSVVKEIKGSESVENIVLENVKTGEVSELPVQGVFVFIGFKPNTWFFETHPKHDDQGYLFTDDRMMTSIPGLFAAGDVRVQLARQITTACGDATTAAIAAEKYIENLKHTQPDLVAQYASMREPETEPAGA